MAWVSPQSSFVSKKFTEHLFQGKRWWKHWCIDSAFGRAILEAGRNHATSVQPLIVGDEVTYGITISGSDNLYLISNNQIPDITPSQKYSDELPQLLRIALTYADLLAADFKGLIEEPILPSIAYKRQHNNSPD